MRRDLSGARIGTLTILGEAEPSARGARRWRTLCDCGREETILQSSLIQPKIPRPIRACAACEMPPCPWCGGPVTQRTRQRCGSIECDLLAKRAVMQAHHQRQRQDPAKAGLLAAQRSERYLRRKAGMTAEEHEEAKRKMRERARAKYADPAQRALINARQREYYAANAAALREGRKAWLDSLPPDRMARWMERMRGYQRAYAAQHRAEIRADPKAHRRYLDLRAEYRRRLALARLMAQATQLKEMIDE